MTDIRVEKGKPLVIGNLKIDAASDHITLTDTNIKTVEETSGRNIGTFQRTDTNILALADHHIDLDWKSVSTFENKHGQEAMSSASAHAEIASSIPYAVTQEIRDAYKRAAADGVIDEREQAQFRALSQEIEQLRTPLTEATLQPLMAKAKAIAPGK